MGALEVQIVATCKCGCGQVPMKGRDYAWGHKPGGMKAEKTTAIVKRNGATPPIDASPNFAVMLRQLEGERDRLEAAIEAIRPLVR
jgi:hypothetical protein